MPRNILLAEIDWRLKQRGSKELTARLQAAFADDQQNLFANWGDDELAKLIIFLKQDEQTLMDIFLQWPLVSKETIRAMVATGPG